MRLLKFTLTESFEKGLHVYKDDKEPAYTGKHKTLYRPIHGTVVSVSGKDGAKKMNVEWEDGTKSKHFVLTGHNVKKEGGRVKNIPDNLTPQQHKELVEKQIKDSIESD